MAIAFDDAKYFTSKTQSYTNNGSALILFVGGAVDTTDTVTYGGTSMTLHNHYDAGVAFGNFYSFSLLNPPTGANSFSINDSGTIVLGACMSYTGVDTTTGINGYSIHVETGGVVAIATNGSAPTVPGSWGVCGTFMSGGNIDTTAGIRWTDRVVSPSPSWVGGDSNTPLPNSVPYFQQVDNLVGKPLSSLAVMMQVIVSPTGTPAFVPQMTMIL